MRANPFSNSKPVQKKMAKKAEPYFNLINNPTHFRVLCTT